MIKLANVTMHDQSSYLEDYRKLGFEIVGPPLLREVSGAEDAIKCAFDAVTEAGALGADGILLGGRTDLCIYAALYAADAGLSVFVAETKRIRDENDRFVFTLAGVTPVKLTAFADGYWGWGVQVDDFGVVHGGSPQGKEEDE